MQSVHPSSRDCFTVSKRLAVLDGNTPSAWHRKKARPHKGNKHQSINTLVLLWGESCRWPFLPMTLLFNREGGGSVFRPTQASLSFTQMLQECFFSFVSLWCLFTPLGCLKASRQISSSSLQIWQTRECKLPNPQTHKRGDFNNYSRSVSEEQQACSC